MVRVNRNLDKGIENAIIFQFQILSCEESPLKLYFQQRFVGRGGSNHLIPGWSRILGMGNIGSNSQGQEHKGYTNWKEKKEEWRQGEQQNVAKVARSKVMWNLCVTLRTIFHSE